MPDVSPPTPRTHIHLGRRQGEGRGRQGGQRQQRAQVRVDGAVGGAGAPLPHQLPVRDGALVMILWLWFLRVVL